MPILDEDINEVRRLLEFNLIGPLSVTQTFTPLLTKVIER